jgi:hypothetical protein
MLCYTRTSKHASFAFSFCHSKLLTIPPWSVTSIPFCQISTQWEVSVCPCFGSILALLPCQSLKVSPFHLAKSHRKTVSFSLHIFPPKHISPFRWWFLWNHMEEQCSLITVCYVIGFISLDYIWLFSYPLLNGLTIYIIWFTTKIIKDFLMYFVKSLHHPLEGLNWVFPSF